MQLRQSSRSQAKIKLGLQGASGTGKTMSALLLAYGLCGQWNKIAIIDSENGSADLYAHLGQYNVLSISAPFSPEKYVEAVQVCEKAGMAVIIIDSISHEWTGSGGILDIHGNMAGNSFTNWAKVTPRHNAFINAMLQSPTHIIATLRTKQDYVLQEKNGKYVPEKIGLKSVQREDTDFELTLVFDIDIKHQAVASKDRTGLFMDLPSFTITTETGKKILQWCNSGKPITNESETNKVLIETLTAKINTCKTVDELLALYHSQSPAIKEQYANLFSQKRKQFIAQAPNEATHISQHLKVSSNGTISNKT